MSIVSKVDTRPRKGSANEAKMDGHPVDVRPSSPTYPGMINAWLAVKVGAR